MAEQLISTAEHGTPPNSYVRPETQRPSLREVVVTDADIPVVDLTDPDRAAVVARVAEACRTHGFFQVLGHGVPEELTAAMLAVAYDFFRLPAEEEKAKLYSDDDPVNKMRLSTSSSFNVRKETVHNWRDYYLRLHCHPLEHYVHEWPDNPPSFRETVSAYCREVRELGFRLYGAISEGLGLEPGYIKEMLGEQEQHMAVNLYPRCPCPAPPELTYGLPALAHTDPNALTILLLDHHHHHMAGLQVLKDGRWIAVNPRPGALVVNIGDQLQALSNGRYKSVWHRAVVNSDIPRMSVASFLFAGNDVRIGPAARLVTAADTPAVYYGARASSACTWKKKNIICSGSGISVSEIPLSDRATRTTFSTRGENAAPDATGSSEPVGTRRSAGSPPEPPAPPATATSVATTTVNEEAMKLLQVIIGASFIILVNIKDIDSSWKTEWKVLFGIFVILSLASTVTSIFTASSPADSWRSFSAFCARFGLLVATALFVVFLACQVAN